MGGGSRRGKPWGPALVALPTLLLALMGPVPRAHRRGGACTQVGQQREVGPAARTHRGRAEEAPSSSQPGRGFQQGRQTPPHLLRSRT